MLVVSCAAPRHTVSAASGELIASDRALAERLAEVLDELTPQVRTLLVDCRAELPRVEVVDDELNGRQALTYEDRILLGRRSRGKEPGSLAHELVHWYTTGYWDCLPPAVEEGLANLVSNRLVPTHAVEKRIQAHWILREAIEGSFPTIEPRSLLELSRDELAELSYGPKLGFAYSLGFVIAEAIGIEGLRELCLSSGSRGLARVPVEELLSASSVDPEHLELLADRLTPWPVIPGQGGTVRFIPDW